jgi:uncharacterized protein with GYD domain
MSVHAVVLIECEIDEIPEAAQAIADLEGVSEVYSVAGEFDLVAIVRVANHDDLASVIPGGISKVDGVARTETLIAFQVYSKHDLERLFSIGFDESPSESVGRQIDRDRSSGPGPLRQVVGVARPVLLQEQTPGQGVLLRIVHDPSTADQVPVADS